MARLIVRATRALGSTKGGVFGVQADEIVDHQNLPVAVWTRRNADGWNIKLVPQRPSQFRRRFNAPGKSARRLMRQRVFHQLRRIPLFLETAQYVHVLRKQPMCPSTGIPRWVRKSTIGA